MSRGASIQIHSSAITANYQLAQQYAQDSQVLAVIKANAYGHGLVPVAKHLSEANGFAVAILEEAIELRQAGIQQPILLLEGVLDQASCVQALQLNCHLVVHSEAQVVLLETFERQFQADSDTTVVWLKIDTGMHRLGFPPHQTQQVLRRLGKLACVEKVVMMTHMACADQPQHPMVSHQLQQFWSAVPQDKEVSFANSGMILNYSKELTRARQWIRPGVMLYGGSPDPNRPGPNHALKPAMSCIARIIAVQHLKLGDSVGYGARFTASQPMRIGIVGLGYGDGYPRQAPNGTPVWVAGQIVELVGLVSMDMLTIDISSVPEANVGSEVELWGQRLPIDWVAKSVGTISYELMCQLMPRLPRYWL